MFYNKIEGAVDSIHKAIFARKKPCNPVWRINLTYRFAVGFHFFIKLQKVVIAAL